MICKSCKIEKADKNFHILDVELDTVCSQCRAAEKIAERNSKESTGLNKEGCFADINLKTCLILKEKDCYKCNFYKTVDQLDEINKAMLGIKSMRR